MFLIGAVVWGWSHSSDKFTMIESYIFCISPASIPDRCEGEQAVCRLMSLPDPALNVLLAGELVVRYHPRLLYRLYFARRLGRSDGMRGWESRRCSLRGSQWNLDTSDSRFRISITFFWKIQSRSEQVKYPGVQGNKRAGIRIFDNENQRNALPRQTGDNG